MSGEKQKMCIRDSFCAMASRNGIRIPEDSTDIRSYNPESINLMERMKEYNVRYCSTYEYDIKKDIEMIQDFYPETEHLVFVSDNTYNGLAELAWFKKNLQHFPQLSITYVDGRIHTLDMAASQLRNLPRNTDVYKRQRNNSCLSPAFLK